MDRRDFIKKSGLLLGGFGVSTAIHPAILRAMEIKPAPGSTFYDAEHVVILMQENRSFDHCFGALRGVRGFRDKYTFRKPNGKSVFFQSNNKGQTYAPFNLDIKNTKATWMDSLPHSWENQQAAFNQGKYDQWLTAKQSGIKEYSDFPLTLGYYDRKDLPFYYQLADAFTVFDQYFCSSMTGTTPNRLFLWSGTIRDSKSGDVQPHVVNATVGYSRNVHWKTFPELLEENNVSWAVYQNEISLPKGMKGQQEPYLANFTDNPLEWFSQYHVKFSPKYLDFAINKVREITDKLSKNPENKVALEKELKYYQDDIQQYDPKNWDQLSEVEKNLHKKAFTINSGDPHFWDLEEIDPVDGEKMYIPKGDVLHQFRKDVKEGKLPTVSWLVAPERFSDHPTSPWYGAWYISEVMNILTENPEVWKKTIFILNYDENDGYFDHIVPFLPPNNPSQKPDFHGETGADFVNAQQEYFTKEKLYGIEKVEGYVGLGFRVPMVIASPWTVGGYVNSEVSDHTSLIQFLENFISKKTKKSVKLDNISNWRRAVCGNLESAFQQNKQNHDELDFLKQKAFVESINAAKNKPLPNNFKIFTEEQQNKDSEFFPEQENGVKPSNPLPYRYEVNFAKEGVLMTNLGEKGVPLLVYDRLKLDSNQDFLFPYTLFSKQKLTHNTQTLKAYNWEVFGPNGFYRNFIGDQIPKVDIKVKLLANGNVEINLKSVSANNETIDFVNDYTQHHQVSMIDKTPKFSVDTSHNGGWYDFTIRHRNNIWVFAGRVETGKVSMTDPHWA